MTESFKPNTQEQCEALGYAIYNPHDKPLSELPFIWGFNNGGSSGFMHGTLIAQDGTGLGGHLCSHEGFMYGDLGVRKGSRKDRHETFQGHYPDGYVMDFVTNADVQSHPALLEAFRLNAILREKSEAKEAAAESTVG